MKQALLTIVLMLLPLMASADTIEIGGIYYNLNKEVKTAEVTENPSKYQDDVTIPNTIEYNGKAYSVTSIGDSAFYNCYRLTSIAIPNSVSTIGNSAFNTCFGLTSITIPNSVTSMGDYAFAFCTGLTSITIPNSVTSIGDYAFAFCTGLTSVSISNSLANIGHCAFVDCISLISITIPNSVTNIGDCAFGGCSGLTSITIPNSVTRIGFFAFYYCSGLTSVSIPNSVTRIENYAFEGCSGLTSINIEAGNMKYDSRDNCNGIIETESNTLIVGCKNTTIPNSVTSIGDGAFSGCSGLSSVTIGNNVTSIGLYAFRDCSGLTSVIIGTKVTSIKVHAFEGCHSLTSVTACNYFDIDERIFDDEIYKSATLHVPMGWKSIFDDEEGWEKFVSIEEIEMTDMEFNGSLFDHLHSKRIILSYTGRDGNSEGGSWGQVNPTNRFVQAIMFPKERMMRIKGNQITSIRLGLWHTDFTDMKVWIGTAKDKHDLLVQDVSNLKKGWSDVALEQPYTITGDSIFVGVEYSTDITLPVKWDAYAGNDIDCYCFGRINENEWETGKGTWFIQCLVEGDSIPEKDIQIVELAGPLYKRAIKVGEDYDCTLIMRNWGGKSVDRSDLLCLLDGKEIECLSDFKIPRGVGRKEIPLRLVPNEETPIGRHKLTISPKKQEGMENQYSETPKEIGLPIYEHDMGRQKVLIQVYTGTWCGYCPEFDELVEQKMKERDDLVLLSVHSRDAYSNEVNNNYSTILYRNGIPDVDLNRCVWQTPYNYRTYTIEEYLDDAKAQPSFANVNISGTYNDTNRTINITVSGERNEDFVPVEEWTNLTVLLVEDHVLGYQTDSDLSPNYPHNGVIRTNLSLIWGDLVQWNGDHYEMHYSARLNETWNEENMRIVAFLSKPFTGDNYDEINVLNCDEIRLKDVASSIREISNDHIASDIYDLNGRKISSKAKSLEGLPKGIYIINGKKIMK